MSIRSLQKIISLENELYEIEQAEIEKTTQWLKKQEEEILRQHEEKISILEKKIELAREEAIAVANQEAIAKLKVAKDKAVFLANLEEPVLRRYLENLLKFIIEPIL